MAEKVLEVNRTDLRQQQSKWLKQARGKQVLLVRSNDPEEEKIVLDRRYFEEMLRRQEGLVETLEIAMDRRLFGQILAAADTLEADVRAGRLHSLEEAFAEE